MGMLAAALGLAATGCAGGGDVAGPQNRVCPPSDCESGATYTGRIKLAAADRARAEITVCRNAVCATAYPAQQAGSNLAYSAALLGPLGGRVQLTGSSDLTDASDLLVQITGAAGSLNDGDVYMVRVSLPGQMPLFELTRAATYQVVRAAGSDCDPGCKQATL